jgi:hypothetical protein
MLAVLGGVALVGCQAQPGTAAWVGDTRFSDNQIEADAAAIQADLDKATPPGQLRFGNARVELVELSVFNALAGRYAAEQGITVPAPNYDASAAQFHLPASDPIVRLSAQKDAYQAALLPKATPVQPSEADLHAAYDSLIQGGLDIGPYEAVRPQLLTVPTLAPGLGLKAALGDAAQRYGIGVSPRYLPVQVPVADLGPTGVAVVALPLGEPEGSPAVHFAS